MNDKPHDKYVRAVFSQPKHAGDLLRMFLDERISAELDLSDVRLVRDSLVSEKLQAQELDLLFRVDEDGEESFVYILFEHQSIPEELMPLRLLRYVSCAYDYLRKEEEARIPCPILPIVFYTGKRPWLHSRSLSGLLTRGRRKKVPWNESVELEFILIDLWRIADEEILSWVSKVMPSVVMASLALKHVHTSDLMQKLERWSELLAAVYRENNEGLALQLLIWYFLKSTSLSRGDLAKVLVPATRAEVKEMIETTGDKLIREGRKEGRKEAKGELASTILALLDRRFGPLGNGIQEKLDDADFRRLLVFYERALKSDRLDEVFAQ